jgi:hypothetical protein
LALYTTSMTIQAGLGVSSEKNTLQAVQAAIKQAWGSLPTAKISLAIVFSTVEFASTAVLKTISAILGQVPIVGYSSYGIITSLGIYKRGIAILLVSLPADVYFNTACVKDISKKSATIAGEELGDKLLYGFKDIRRDLGVIFSDGLINEEASFLDGLQERLGRSFPLTGASASDSLSFKKNYIYFNNELLNDTACGILWGGKLNFGLGVKHGWKPLGKPRIVTSSSGNVVYEIDNVPAASIYKEYFASDIDQLRNDIRRISVLYPVGIYLPGEEEYLLRNIVSVEDDESLIFQGEIPEKSQIRLMIGTKESCLAATNLAAQESIRSLFGKKCVFAFVFNSVSRSLLLGRQGNKELDILKDKLGKDTPIIGAYTYEEQAPLRSINYQGKTYFHNQAIAILGVAS